MYFVPVFAQVKRNLERFPEEFMFQLTKEEKADVIAFCDNPNSIRFSPQPPYVFTEYGAIMLAVEKLKNI